MSRAGAVGEGTVVNVIGLVNVAGDFPGELSPPEEGGDGDCPPFG